MAENNAPNSNGSANNQKKPNNKFFSRQRFYGKRDSGPRQNAISFPIPHRTSSEHESDTSFNAFQIGGKKSPYSGWQLYFPEVGTYSQDFSRLYSQYLNIFIFQCTRTIYR